MRPVWEDLDRAGADLVLNGHEHFYRSPTVRAMRPGIPCRPGCAQIIAGTGGAQLRDLSLAGGYKTYARVHGVLELHLQKDRYEYAFRTLDGQVRDSTARAQCRRSKS